MDDEIARLRQALAEAESRASEEQRRREAAERRGEEEQHRREEEQHRREAAERRREEEQHRREEEQRRREAAERRGEEEQHRREAAERRREEEQHRREEEQHRREAAERRREAAERLYLDTDRVYRALQAQNRPTTLAEYLRSLQTVIRPGLRIETNRAHLARGDANKVDLKVYPRVLRPWTEFPALHRAQFDLLRRRLGQTFPSEQSVKGSRANLSPRTRKDERDITPFIRAYMETPAAQIVNAYLETQPPSLYQAIDFGNGNYGLLPPRSIYTAASGDTTITTTTTTTTTTTSRDSPSRGESPSKRRSPQRTTTVPSDRWGVRFAQEDGAESLFLVAEYKAAHKVKPHMFEDALGNSNTRVETLFTDCVEHILLTRRARRGPSSPAQETSQESARGPGQESSAQELSQESPPPLERSSEEPAAAAQEEDSTEPAEAEEPFSPSAKRKVIAKVLCQAYHYIITSGLQYGYVASGTYMVLLYVPRDTPEILYFHNFECSARVDDGDQSMVPAAQLATLALLALEVETRPSNWIDETVRALPKWPATPPKQNQGEQSQNALSLRPIPVFPPPTSCRDDLPHGNNDDDDDDDDDDEDSSRQGGPGGHPQPSPMKRRREQTPPPPPTSQTPAPTSSQQQQQQQQQQRRLPRYCTSPPFCTQKCLLGLVRKAPLDPDCPNTPLHKRRGSRHAISHLELCALFRAQVARNLDDGCACLDKYGMFGATGALFKITVAGYGYTLVAKGVQAPDAYALVHEAAVYAHCSHLQGHLIPVFLGGVDLVRPYYLQSLAVVWHMMLMSWAGLPLEYAPEDVDVDEEMDDAIALLRGAGIEYDDIKSSNCTWNDERGRVMVIDFNLAVIEPGAQTTKKMKIRME